MSNSAAAIAERKIRAAFDPGFVEWELHVVNVDSAEQLIGLRAPRQGQCQRRREAQCSVVQTSLPIELS
jgi:hypothetical protein